MLLNGSRYEVYLGDCLDVMRQLPDNSVDAVVSDPPYGLKFMGKQWDHGVPGEAFWREALRIAKPGAHLFAFGGDRTYHRLACAVEDAGWDLRRMFLWVYGSGFPKSLDISKAMDKAAGVERTTTKTPMGPTGNKYAAGLGDTRPWMLKAAELGYHEHPDDTPISDPAKQWSGWGTDVKPALEPIALARKPFKGTVCDNVQQWGTGGLNIDGCRVPMGSENTQRTNGTIGYHGGGTDRGGIGGSLIGRFPANLIHDGSEEAIAGFPINGAKKRELKKRSRKTCYGAFSSESIIGGYDDPGGSASRYFYCAKASHSERGASNNHPTVKPITLMRYLCRLITPPHGIILDPFMGSGSTGVAALQEGFRFIGIEKSPEYLEIAKARLEQALPSDNTIAAIPSEVLTNSEDIDFYEF